MTGCHSIIKITTVRIMIMKTKIIKTRIIKAITATLCSIGFCSLLNLAQASGLLVEIDPYYYQLPKSVSDVCEKEDNCPEIEISYLNTSQPWINRIINQQINTLIAGESVYPAVMVEGHPPKMPTSVKLNLDNFATTQMEHIAEGAVSIPYSQSVVPRYLGHTGSLELFQIGGYDYFGGAHGIGFAFYQVLDSDIKKAVSLDDILLKAKKAELSKLVEAEFEKWLVDEQGTTPEEHKEYWEFSLTDNVTFSDKGLSFLYQPYEIAPYASGMPEMTVSYDKLDGIIKAKYLLAGRQLANK